MKLTSCYDYRSRRSPIVSGGGAVASSQPLATQAGIEILQKGGNAADAAVAVAAALQVTQPRDTGLGGDCFCLFREAESGRIHALNGSGRSPRSLTRKKALQAGLENRLPETHPFAVTVPGAPAAWQDLVNRLGRLDLKEVLTPAIELAENGFPAAPLSAIGWATDDKLFHSRCGHELLIEGKPPVPGQMVRLPHLAQTLITLAEEGSAPFYTGRIAETVVKEVGMAGGLLALEDLASHESEWVEPISIDYRGIRVWECPPNGQGLAALLALNCLARFDPAELEEESPERYHLLIECMRLAFADSAAYIADPRDLPFPVSTLLTADYAGQRAGMIDRGRAHPDSRPGWTEGSPADVAAIEPAAGSDTVYLAVVDRDGNACSFIGSIYKGFGTGIVPEGCGYSLQNRGSGFVLAADHPNSLEPGKRPYHTIIPGLATKSGKDSLYAVFGVMGGMMQPQGHLQVVSAMVDDDVDPQAALDRPRFCLEEGMAAGSVLLEDSVDDRVRTGLTSRGHDLIMCSGKNRSSFGRGQIIRRASSGVLWAGSDPRGDGCALGLR